MENIKPNKKSVLSWQKLIDWEEQEGFRGDGSGVTRSEGGGKWASLLFHLSNPQVAPLS